MIKKLILAAALLVTTMSANAASLNGPLIKHVRDDRAFYSAGSEINVYVDLVNGTGSAFDGKVNIATCSRGQTVGLTAQNITLASGASSTMTFQFTVPTLAAKAYQLSVVALNSSDTASASCSGTGSSSSSPVDIASGAINVAANAQEDPIEAYVDPQAMQSVTDYSTITDNLAQYHIGLVQFYDWGYRHDEPYTTAATWQNLQNIPVTKTETTSLIQAFWKYGVFNQLYTSWNGAYSDWPTADTSVKIGMGVFTNQCGLTGTCTVNDQFWTASGWKSFGWVVDGSVQENPANGYWMSWIASQYQAAMSGWGFNGVHLDTMGDPIGSTLPDGTTLQTLYNGQGQALPDLGDYLANFANYVQSYTGVCTDINLVSGWNLQGESVNGNSCNMYIEPHPEFNNYPYFASVDALVQQMREWTSRPLITAYYPQQVLSGSLDKSYAISGDTVTVCDPTSNSSCTASNPGIELMLGQIAVSGASELAMGDYDHLIPGPFFPRATLKIDSDLQQYLADYWNWFVASRDLLRGNNVTSTQIITIANSSGTNIGSSTGDAGDVYYRAWQKPGIAVGASLTNLVGLTNARVDDPDGLHNPTAQTNLSMTMQAYGLSPTGNLYYSAPDIDHGFPQKLTYTVSGTSNYTISFTLPSLKTAAIVWLEANNLQNSNDWTLDATSQQFIQGGSATWAPNGMGASGGVSVHGCCGRAEYWDNIDFGTSSSVTTLSALTQSATGGTVVFHLDTRDGPVLAKIVAPATSGGSFNTSTVNLPSSPSGTHRVWVEYPGADVSLLSWRP